MKKTKLMLSIGMLAFAGMATTLTSCTGNDEPCPVGYEGEDCETLSRDKFIGNWDGSDVCGSGSYDIELQVLAATDSVKALVKNPGGFGSTVTITGAITDESTLTFTNQDVGGDRILDGKMTINGSHTSLTFSYSVEDVDGDVDDCVGTYSKM